ncbi:hypothetical protein ADJ79_05450 [Ottowia sp. oral taxon 894]|nr:hypothetical protein ADJ79_05450 [Ottowia sp. oral taxon 894]
MRKAALEAAFSFLFRRFAVSDLTSRGQIANRLPKSLPAFMTAHSGCAKALEQLSIRMPG